jgi:hypothetical protein
VGLTRAPHGRAKEIPESDCGVTDAARHAVNGRNGIT